MAHFLLDRLAELARLNAATLAPAGVDVLALDDDVGMPGTMMISPTTWREFFKPRLAGIIEAARAVRPDLRVIYHSDGHFEPILDDLVEIGVAAINPLQPEHMDAVRIRRRFGPRLALWGTVGRQTTFAFADPEAIRREVRTRIETLGRAGLDSLPGLRHRRARHPVGQRRCVPRGGRDLGLTGRRRLRGARWPRPPARQSRGAGCQEDLPAGVAQGVMGGPRHDVERDGVPLRLRDREDGAPARPAYATPRAAQATAAITNGSDGTLRRQPSRSSVRRSASRLAR